VQATVSAEHDPTYQTGIRKYRFGDATKNTDRLPPANVTAKRGRKLRPSGLDVAGDRDPK
jgi:hypothetical protein